MGVVTQRLAAAAMAAGARIHTGQAVERVLVEGGAAVGVATAGGREHAAHAVVVNADPFRMRGLVGAANLGPELNAKLDGMRREGNTMKARAALGCACRAWQGGGMLGRG